MTPSLPDDLEVMSRPVTYLTLEAVAIDGKEHSVRGHFDASAEIAANVPAQEIQTTSSPNYEGPRHR
jgi:hypothetical protein